MRKTLLILSLATVTVLAGASDAFAQRRGYYGGGGYYGGRGYAPGISIGVGGGYNSPYSFYGGRTYSSYNQGYGYDYAPNYYYSAPSYYLEPTYSVPTTQIRPSYYAAPAATQQSVNVKVLLPDANAQVWFENGLTTQRGTERLFQSPPLEPNQTFTYTVKARWLENGQAVNRESQLKVQAGQNYTVNFRNVTREDVQPPLPPLPTAIPRK